MDNETWAIRVSPETLAITATPRGLGEVVVAESQVGLGPVSDERLDWNRATWSLPDVGISVALDLDGGDLTVQFVSDRVGEFRWPHVVDHAARGYILPLHEGSYVPRDHLEWRRYLVDRGKTNTTEGLSMPFWGVDYGDYTLTYIATNQLNNAYWFEEDGDWMSLRFAHEFTRNWERKEYGFVVRLGGPSPVEPARNYREWLIERGEFVSMREKVERTPDAAKLLGAAHIYLWGDKLLTRHDVRDWPAFVAALRAADSPPVARLVSRLSDDARDALGEIDADGIVYKYLKDALTDGVSEALRDPKYYDEAAWRGLEVGSEVASLLTSDRGALGEPDIYRLNSLLLAAAVPDLLLSPETWGDGVSTKMMDRFIADGFDRLWLGLDSWQGGFRHPEAIARAQDAGYLIGPYDSFHSIHDPDEEDTWETAQFDRELYETGGIIRADGSHKRGFKQKGYNLSPIAARPHVERRVNGIVDLMRRPYNSWFVDCDAYGELFDDYSPLHPATQLDDMRERLRRSRGIGRWFSLRRLDHPLRPRHDDAGHRMGRSRVEGQAVAVLPRRLLATGRPGGVHEASTAEAGLTTAVLRPALPAASVPDGVPRLGRHDASVGIRQPEVLRPDHDNGPGGGPLRRATHVPHEPRRVRQASAADVEALRLPVARAAQARVRGAH